MSDSSKEDYVHIAGVTPFLEWITMELLAYRPRNVLQFTHRLLSHKEEEINKIGKELEVSLYYDLIKEAENRTSKFQDKTTKELPELVNSNTLLPFPSFKHKTRRECNAYALVDILKQVHEHKDSLNVKKFGELLHKFDFVTNVSVIIPDAKEGHEVNSYEEKFENTMAWLPLNLGSLESYYIEISHNLSEVNSTFFTEMKDILRTACTTFEISSNNIEMHREANRFALIRDFLLSITSQFGPSSILFMLSNKTAPIIEAERSCYFVFDAKAKRVIALNNDNMDENDLEAYAAILCCTHKRQYIFDNVKEDDRIPQKYLKDQTINNMIVLPICLEEKIGAVVVLNKINDGKFTIEDIDLLKSIISLSKEYLVESPEFNLTVTSGIDHEFPQELTKRRSSMSLLSLPPVVQEQEDGEA